MSLTVAKGEKINSAKKNGKNFFNKKKWREQKYSNKEKVRKWDNMKKKQALRNFHRELKKTETDIGPREQISQQGMTKSHNPFKEAQLKYQRIQQEKEEKRKKLEETRKQRKEALEAYKERKAMRFAKLSQKTKKGQPLMKGRIELLLEKIQKEYANKNV